MSFGASSGPVITRGGRPSATQSWYVAAPTSELIEGRAKVVRLANRAISVGRIGTRFFALNDTCPHAGASLGEGEVEDGSLICPLHAWQFDVSTGKCPQSSKTVATYPTRVVNGNVEVYL